MSLIIRGNIYNLNELENPENEVFETLAQGSSIIERIVSFGHTTPKNQWFDQTTDEWVILLQGEAMIHFVELETVSLVQGDYLFIPSHVKHRVISTSKTPPCIWIAVHGALAPTKVNS